MADQIDPAAIAKAREAGYSDTEIADHLAEKTPGIKSAREAGYSDKEILSHLAQEPAGVVAGVNHGMDEATNNLKSTAKYYLGVGDGPKPEDPNYVPANVTNGSINPLNWNYSQLPQKAAELAPGIAEQLVAAKTGATVGSKIGGLKGAALGAMLASGATLWANSAGHAAKSDAVDRTGDENAEPNTADKTRAGLTSAVSAAAQSVFPTRFVAGPTSKAVGASGALDAVKKYLANTALAGGAGAAGNVIDQVGNTVGTDKGLRVDPGQTGDAALGNAVLAGSLGAPRALAETYNASKQSVFGGANADATAAYFQRLKTNAGDDGLANPKNSFKAQENTKRNLKLELQGVDASNLPQDTANTLSLARNGSPLTEQHVKQIEAADPAAGHLARQMYVAQQAEKFGTYDPSNQQWAGGVSGVADKYAKRAFKAHLLIGGGAALMGHPMVGAYAMGTLGLAGGGYAGTRLVDSITGMRSPANAMAEKFADANVPSRLPPVTAPPPPPPAPTPGPAQPWGPVPPASGPTGPQVPPPAAPAPPQQGTQPWQAPQVTQLPQFSPLAMAALKQKLKQGLPPEPTPAPEPAPQEPAPPQLSPIAMKMLQAKLKAGLPQPTAPPAPAPEPAPQEPSPPQLSPIAMKMLQMKLKQGLPPEPAAPPPAPPEPPAAPVTPQVNPMRLPTDITAPAKNLMSGLARVKAMQAASNPAPEPAAAPAAQPLQVNGSSAPTSMANILKRVNAITAPAKISKKAGGEVKVEHAPQSDDFSWDHVGGYDPAGVENPFRGMTAHQIARKSADAMTGLPELSKLSYYNKALGTRTARDNVIEQLKQGFPGEQSILDELRQDIHAPGNSDQAQSMRVIKKYTSLMSPEAAQATRAAFRRADVRDAIWPPTKAKTHGKSKKAKEEVPASSST